MKLNEEYENNIREKEDKFNKEIETIKNKLENEKNNKIEINGKYNELKKINDNNENIINGMKILVDYKVSQK